MLRREFCQKLAATCGAVSLGRRTREPPPGVVWRREYDVPIDAAVPAHGGGFAFVGVNSSGEFRVRIVTTDETGRVQNRAAVEPGLDTPGSRLSADLLRTPDGYAVATGSWFGRFDRDLTVAATGQPDGSGGNSWTRLATLSDGFVVASEYDAPNHVQTELYAFDADGTHRWTNVYGARNSKGLGFLIERDGGVTLGGTFGEFWLAGVNPDGTDRFRESRPSFPDGPRPSAVVRADGLVIFNPPVVVRLDGSRSVVWRRSYDGFSEGGGSIEPVSGGGFTIAANSRIARVSERGELLWRRPYLQFDVRTGGLVESAPGTYLAVGTFDDTSSVAVQLSEDVTPTPTPTQTETRSPTATRNPESTESRSRTTETDVTTPGVTLAMGAAGIAGLAGWLRHRSDDE